MTSTRIYPREEQIAELTRGEAIPFPPLLEVHLLYISEVLVRAWKSLLSRYRQLLLSGAEAEVTALIESRLNALLNEDRIWAQLVRNVTRGTERISYDGSHLEKRPDLSVHLTNRNPSFPLIVECKLIDIALMKTAELYCAQGLARFLKGEYAWATREAFMLAYVRDGSTIVSCLTPFLATTCAKGRPGPYFTHSLPERVRQNSHIELARSHHHRRFRYIGRATGARPGPIAIWHLWLFGSTARKKQKK